ncbi:hypothetical protein BV504_21370 [Halomonas sp. 'Soap Lake |nr:hypothetical protein B2G49_21530 [Halomonas sp. 'Soap Lake \
MEERGERDGQPYLELIDQEEITTSMRGSVETVSVREFIIQLVVCLMTYIGDVTYIGSGRLK